MRCVARESLKGGGNASLARAEWSTFMSIARLAAGVPAKTDSRCWVRGDARRVAVYISGLVVFVMFEKVWRRVGDAWIITACGFAMASRFRGGR